MSTYSSRSLASMVPSCPHRIDSRIKRCASTVREGALSVPRGLGAKPSRLFGGNAARSVPRRFLATQARSGLQSEADREALADRAQVLGEMNIWSWRRQTLLQLAAFVVPALSISLADATMSLVDTLCIGRFGSTEELAALGPNTVVFNFASYIFFSVGLATNTLVGRFLRRGEALQASRVVSQALMLGGTAGLLMGSLIALAGRPLLLACGSTPEVAEIAFIYLKIRALAIPAVVCVNAAQSGLMAQRNSARPALAVLTAALVNIVLDVIFIRNMGMGIAGAAIATVIGQFCALGMLILPYLHRDARVRLVAVLPQRSHIEQFGSCVGPIFVVIAAKNACYILIQSAATSLRVLLVAAHQAVWSMWAVGAFCCSPMEQAALAFLPTARSGFEKRELVRMLLLGGTFVGVVAATCTCLPPLFNPQFFTRDPRLWAPMQTVCWQGFFAMTFAGLEVAVNGILLAEGETMFLARAMVTNLTITAAYFFTKGRSGSLPDVWWGLVLFFCTRTVQALIRLSQISKRLSQHAHSKE